jgi:hypothetical protein
MMRRAFSVVAVAALVILTACGGDDDESTSGTTVPAATPTTAAGTTFTGEGSQEFCAIARANIASVQQAVLAFASNPTDGANLLKDVAPKVRDTAARAPAEIKPAVTVLAESFEKLLDDIDAGNSDYSAINSPEFREAAQALTSYGTQVCGIRP